MEKSPVFIVCRKRKKRGVRKRWVLKFFFRSFFLLSLSLFYVTLNFIDFFNFFIIFFLLTVVNYYLHLLFCFISPYLKLFQYQTRLAVGKGFPHTPVFFPSIRKFKYPGWHLVLKTKRT